MSTKASAPPLVVRTGEGERSLAAGRAYLVGRDPQADIVVADPRVSWHHAELRAQNGRWALVDLGSTNGSYAGGQRADLIEIDGTRQVRFGDPEDGTPLDCVLLDYPAPDAALLDQTGRPARRIGRVPDNDIVVPHVSVSRHHAELRTTPGGYRIVDLGSHNGTFVNEQRITEAALAEGDSVGFGDTTFRLAGGELLQIASPAEAQMPPAPDPMAETAIAAAPGGLGGAGSPSQGGSGGMGPPGKESGGVLGGVAPPEASTALVEIPYAVRWLVPRGERFANFDILNDNDTQLDYYRRFGHIYAVGIPTRKWRLVVVSDPDLLDEVAGDEERFGKRVEEINFFAQLANSRGGGLSVIGDGAHYEQVRRVMLPWYSPAHQRTQLDRMKDQARKLVTAWAALPDDEPLDARAWMERYTLEVSGRGACAYDFGLLGADSGAASGADSGTGGGIGGGRPHPFAAAVPASTKESILRVADPRPDFTLFAGRTRRARRKAYRQHNAELFRTADALVRARMHTCPLGPQTDLLSRLVSTPDPETGEFLDAETIRDQILMHLSNGFNGPSITAAWLAYVLATNPDVEQNLIAEIDGITGGDPDYDLRYDDLMALPYTTAVIKETMRIYPPMPVTIRRSLKDGTLGRYRIRKGDIILVGTLAAQRDPRYWGPEPDRFDPEQFTMDKIAGRPRHAFIPFSIGKRQCMAQEVTFMMLRVVLFEIYRRYRLRLAPGATVVKNAVVTTKPAAVPVIRVPREVTRPGPGAGLGARPAAEAIKPDRSAPSAPDWGQPMEIPPASAYRHVVIAYGSNFGASKELAERFAERSDFNGYTTDVITLNQLADAAPRTEPWLLVVMTSTYTSNPPSNATAFRTWLERTPPGTGTWRNCRYLVWGLGNSQWNAFLAFPRYVQQKLAELGATPLADLGFGDVGSPVWERLHADWNSRVWPVLLELSGARPTAGAAERVAGQHAATGALTGTDSNTAMHRSLFGDNEETEPMPRPASATSILRRLAPDGTSSRVMLAPAILTNAVGVRTAEARVLASSELQPGGGPKRTRQLDICLPPGVTYRAGDHLGVCPKNDEERVERLAGYLGAALDGLFMAPKTMNVRAVPKGVVLQVRNVLTNLVDISGRPGVPLLDLLIDKAASPGDRARLTQIRDVLADPGGLHTPDGPLRAAIEAGGYDVLRLLDDFPSCSLNIFEFLRVAQPLRPRYYSASSSPRVHGEGVVQVTVGLEATPVPGGHPFRGMGSHYLHTLRAGARLNVFLDSADGFRLQQDVTKPMIFVSAGTGLAPMRAFGWERLAMQRAGVTLAEAALFNGIRSAGQDYIYRDEIARFAAEGVLNHVHVAMSREQPGHREYVQDRIRAQGALVWRMLAAGGYVYVCGSQPMRDAVRAAFTDVIADHGGLARDHAAAYLDELETTARYRPDLWV